VKKKTQSRKRIKRKPSAKPLATVAAPPMIDLQFALGSATGGA
jgi:hypothetical protein